MFRSKIFSALLVSLAILFTACPEDDDLFGKLVYITGTEGLRILDITDPVAPIEVGFVEILGCQDVKVKGDYAYVTDYYGKTLKVVRVKDERAPVIVGSVTLRDGPKSVAIQDYYAYVTVGEGMQIVDISDPENPGEVSYLDMESGGNIHDIVVEGRYAYLSDYSAKGLVVVDIDDPHNPVITGSCAAGSYIYGIYLEGDYVYMTENNQHGVIVVDVSDPEAPKEVGYSSVFGFNNNIFGDGINLYVASTQAALYDNGGLHVLSYGESPYLYASFKSVTFNGKDVFVKGEYAYVADIKGLRVIRISNVNEMTEMAFLPLGNGGCYGIDLGVR
jgi:hypothetical protein